jgi:hypothetical protein
MNLYLLLLAPCLAASCLFNGMLFRGMNHRMGSPTEKDWAFYWAMSVGMAILLAASVSALISAP